MDTVELVKKAKKGDKEALIELVMNKKSEYYKLAYVYTENKEDAMDALEDMIVILFQKVRTLKNEDSFYSWSKTILVNCCKNLLKKSNRMIYMQEVSEEIYHELYETSEVRLDILQHLKKLNEQQQEAIKLKYFMGLDNESIAKISNVPVGTVKSRISIGLKKLKEYFGGAY